jgi:hypothetical protein
MASNASASGAGDPTENPQAGVEQAHIAETGFPNRATSRSGSMILVRAAIDH